MLVLKFGGTSVAHAANIKKVRDIVAQKQAFGKIVVVVSAFSGTTDALLNCGQMASASDPAYKERLRQLVDHHLQTVRELLPLTGQSGVLSRVVQQFNEIEDICNGISLLGEFSDRIKDRLISYGELISSQIISCYLQSEGMANAWADPREWIITDRQYTRAEVDFPATFARTQEYFSRSDASLWLVPGFIASDGKGNHTTLGRGGSDYTAAIIGAALSANHVEIWTDVTGMMTADPRLVHHAKPVPEISYHEAMELSHFGAKVIYPPTIQPLMNAGIPVLIKNTFAPKDHGTLIQSAVGERANSIRGISSIAKLSLLSLEGSGMIGIPGFSRRLFETLAQQRINVILITQASSEHSICVGIEQQFAEQAKEAVDSAFSIEIERGQLHPLVVEKGLAIIALVGDRMKNHPGISGRMFGVLGRNGVNVRAIAQGSSERNISAVIASEDIKKALNVLHEEFFETTYKQVNLFIAGTGNVGGKLLAQIAQQQEYLQRHLGLQVRIAGLSNSRHMRFSEEGIDPANWKEELQQGEPMELDAFVKCIREKNARNAVFVDVTADNKVAAIYDQLFTKSISVVACNKIACSSPFASYRNLKELSRDFNASFLFETNVGASLPIIGALNDLLRSGDSVTRIEAVLSGTLNYVFNHYNGTASFSEVVRQAQKEGYTEPDPRLDLSGVDVMRKIMILAREAGHPIEMEQIANHSFLPPSCMEGSVEDFYAEMERQEPHFRQLYEGAQARGSLLKFVAAFEDGKASVGLRHIDPEHDFFRLYGKDNIVLFYTNRYVDQPMVIKGAGAGAEVTASGVFADIIRAARV
jgi:aspartokinase/homoserine dehydrogenase 1